MFNIYVDDYLVGFEEKKENARKLCEYNNMVEKEYCSGRYWYYTISHDIDEALEMIKDYKKISRKNAFYELDDIILYEKKTKEFNYTVRLDLMKTTVKVRFNAIPYQRTMTKEIKFYNTRCLIDGFLIHLGENYLERLGDKVVSDYFKYFNCIEIANNKKEAIMMPDNAGSTKYYPNCKPTYYSYDGIELIDDRINYLK